MEREIISGWLEMEGQLTDALRDLLGWLSTDEAVGWFVDSWFDGDADAVRDAIGGEEGQAIAEWYEAHCR